MRRVLVHGLQMRNRIMPIEHGEADIIPDTANHVVGHRLVVKIVDARRYRLDARCRSERREHAVSRPLRSEQRSPFPDRLPDGIKLGVRVGRAFRNQKLARTISGPSKGRVH